MKKKFTRKPTEDTWSCVFLIRHLFRFAYPWDPAENEALHSWSQRSSQDHSQRHEKVKGDVGLNASVQKSVHSFPSSKPPASHSSKRE